MRGVARGGRTSRRGGRGARRGRRARSAGAWARRASRVGARTRDSAARRSRRPRSRTHAGPHSGSGSGSAMELERELELARAQVGRERRRWTRADVAAARRPVIGNAACRGAGACEAADKDPRRLNRKSMKMTLSECERYIRRGYLIMR